MNRFLMAVTAIAVATVACADRAEPAAIAVGKMQGAFDAVRFEALRYAPDEEPPVEAAVTVVTAALVNGQNYDQIVVDAEAVMPRIASLGETVVERKVQLMKTWSDITQALPASLDSAAAQIDVLAAATVRHTTARRAALDSARRALEASTSAWDDARAAFARGNLKDAVQKAESSRAQLQVVTASLDVSRADTPK